MHYQQLKFSLTFIGLGALLGWYSHIVYNGADNNNNDTIIAKNEILNSNIHAHQSDLSLQHKVNSYITEFSDLINKERYDEALLYYQKKEPEKQAELFTVLLIKINELNSESDYKVLDLLKVFLQEYYNNSQLLILNANALILKNQKKQALDSFLLAKNYAVDNEEHIDINNKIHEFAGLTYKQFKQKKEWSESIEFFSKLIENEPEFPFYHLCLAQSYIKSGDEDMAVTSLQWIKDDVLYGEKATMLLDIITLNQLSEGINLEKNGDQYIINSIISDFYEIKLLLDTGASYSSLPSYIIARLVHDNQAEKVGHNQVFTAGGKVDADIYKLKMMTIGSYSVNDIIVIELNLESSQDKINNFEGLLGMNFLSHFDFTIDQQLNQLFLTPKID